MPSYPPSYGARTRAGGTPSSACLAMLLFVILASFAYNADGSRDGHTSGRLEAELDSCVTVGGGNTAVAYRGDDLPELAISRKATTVTRVSADDHEEVQALVAAMDDLQPPEVVRRFSAAAKDTSDRNRNLYALFSIEGSSTWASNEQPSMSAFPQYVTLDAFKKYLGEEWSKLKYGKYALIERWAQLLADHIQQEVPDISIRPEEFVLLRPSAINLDTTATLIYDKLTSLLPKVPTDRMDRKGHLQGDFALMSEAERAVALKGMFSLRSGEAKPASKYILIEDSVVSGAHYKVTQDVLRNQGVSLEHMYAFVLASLNQLTADEEGKLNEIWFSPKEPKIVERLVQSFEDLKEGACPTSRQTKFILKSLSPVEFDDLLTHTHVNKLSMFHTCLQKDGFHAMYRKRFCKLSQKLSPQNGVEGADHEAQRRSCAAFLPVSDRNRNLYALWSIEGKNPAPHSASTSGNFPQYVTITDFKENMGKEWSLLKYGNFKLVQKHAQLLAQRIQNVLDVTKSEIVLLRPSAIELDTTATLVYDHLVSLLPGCKTDRMDRNGHLHGDFAKMSEEDRAVALKGMFALRSSAIRPNAKYILIEDSVVSGAHYMVTQDVLMNEGVKLENIYAFVLASLNDLESSEEGALNEVWFNPKSPEILKRLMHSFEDLKPNGCPTSRQTKFILKTLADTETFDALLAARPKTWLTFFRDCAAKDNFNTLYPASFCKLSLAADSSALPGNEPEHLRRFCASLRSEADRNRNLYALWSIEGSPDPAVVDAVPIGDEFPQYVTLEAFKRDMGEEWSKFKYGDYELVKSYAESLNKHIRHMLPEIEENPTGFVLLRPSAIKLDTAATLVYDRLTELLPEVQTDRMDRTGHLQGDFAKMSEKERAQALKGMFKLRGTVDYDAKYLLIEDSVVSGAHYKVTQDALQDEGVHPNNIYAFVLASLNNLKSSEEGALNEIRFSPAHHLIVERLMESFTKLKEHGCPTSRQTKFVMKSLSKADFTRLAEAMSTTSRAPFSNTLSWFHQCAWKDGFQNMYPERFIELLGIGSQEAVRDNAVDSQMFPARGWNVFSLWIIDSQAIATHVPTVRAPFPQYVQYDAFKSHMGETWSKFLFGKPDVVLEFAELMANNIRDKLPKIQANPENYILLRPWSLTLDTAATLVYDHVVEMLPGVGRGRIASQVLSAEIGWADLGLTAHQVKPDTQFIIFDEALKDETTYVQIQNLLEHLGVARERIQAFVLLNWITFSVVEDQSFSKVWFDQADRDIVPRLMESFDWLDKGSCPTAKAAHFILSKLHETVFEDLLKIMNNAWHKEKLPWFRECALKDGLDEDYDRFEKVMVVKTDLQELGLRGLGFPGTPEGRFVPQAQQVKAAGTFCPKVFCSDTWMCQDNPENCAQVTLKKGEMYTPPTLHDLIDFAQRGAFTFIPKPHKVITHVVMLIVTSAEMLSTKSLFPDMVDDRVMVDRFQGLVDNVLTVKMTKDIAITKRWSKDKTVFPIDCDGCSYQVTILKLAEAKGFQMFKRSQSGFTQAAAVASATSMLFSDNLPGTALGDYNRPDLILSFGTAGARVSSAGKKCSLLQEGKAKVGDIVFSDGNLILPRLRLVKDTQKFNAGLWGGGSVKSDGLKAALKDALKKSAPLTNVHFGPAAATVGYALSVDEQEVFRTLEVSTNDMESGPEAQIFNQVKINFLKVSVVSNGIYLNQGDDVEWCQYGGHKYVGPKGQVQEYKHQDQKVSSQSQAVLAAIFTKLAGKTMEWVAGGAM